jgi:hypothetical protein
MASETGKGDAVPTVKASAGGVFSPTEAGTHRRSDDAYTGEFIFD